MKRAAENYKDVVDKVYTDLLNEPNLSSKLDISVNTPEQIDACAGKVLNLPELAFKDRSQSLFNVGLNSLYALQLWNYIAKYFDDIPQKTLFHHFNIQPIREALMKSEIRIQINTRNLKIWLCPTLKSKDRFYKCCIEQL